ncbi:hypothetical protein MINTM019_34350 [Mycobacterium paraintracellulare]|uniref:Uncharacterized protein n=1 Tax=Mycobacterium avium subsp. hominissuis TaxID=439334 RepID=A0AAI8SLH2_MYCAV|nr:hypothetical protein JPH1_17070 [Mycobacterium avium subsp. hominissuis]BCP05979.1 hypothetical protein MINTM019_34350 [Mycobacterium paraintracellulare]
MPFPVPRQRRLPDVRGLRAAQIICKLGGIADWTETTHEVGSVSQPSAPQLGHKPTAWPITADTAPE